jgi:hypothetical protein
MATIQIKDEEEALVNRALMEFAMYGHIEGDVDVSNFPPLRRMQVEHHRWQANKLGALADTSLAVMSLGIVEEACWELPVAVESDERDEIYDTLGDILIYTLAVCTDLRLDFLVLARDFDPNNIESPQGFDGFMNLFKAIGMLAHVVGKNRQRTRGYDDIDKVRKHAGASVARLCSAVHWLAFNNDWEPSVLMQDVLSRVMKRDWTKNSLDGTVKCSRCGGAPHLQKLDEPSVCPMDTRSGEIVVDDGERD